MVLGWPHLVGIWFKDTWDVRDILAVSISSCGRTDWAYSYGTSAGITREANGDTSVHKALSDICLCHAYYSMAGASQEASLESVWVGSTRVWVEGGDNFCLFL